MPDYLIIYCPEMAVWRVTDCDGKRRVFYAEQIATFPAELRNVFEAAKADPDKTQAINFRLQREAAQQGGDV